MVEEIVEGLKKSPHWGKVRRWVEELRREFAKSVARKVLSEDAEDVIYWIADLQRTTPSKFKSPHFALFSTLWYLVMGETPEHRYRRYMSIDDVIQHLLNTMKEHGISGDKLLEMVKEYAEKNTIKRIELTESGDVVEQRVPIDPFKAYTERFHGLTSGTAISSTVKRARASTQSIAEAFGTEPGVWSEHHWRIFKRLVRLAEKCLQDGWCTHRHSY